MILQTLSIEVGSLHLVFLHVCTHCGCSRSSRSLFTSICARSQCSGTAPLPFTYLQRVSKTPPRLNITSTLFLYQHSRYTKHIDIRPAHPKTTLAELPSNFTKRSYINLTTPSRKRALSATAATGALHTIFNALTNNSHHSA